jgi:branched-chain amino acid transport system substrate-binding protein
MTRKVSGRTLSITYALANGTGNSLTKAGGDTWFLITADYAFGYALQRTRST